MGAVANAIPAVGGLGRAPFGATKRAGAAPKWALPRLQVLPLGPSREPSYGATERAKGVLASALSRLRALPLGPSLELLMGPRSA